MRSASINTVLAPFTFQAHPVPHNELTREQELDYRMQRAFRNAEHDSPASYLQRLVYRTRYYRFYFYPPLYLALVVYLVSMRAYRFVWVALTVLIFALGTNFYPLFLPHYIAAVLALFVLMSVEGLRILSNWRAGAEAARVLIYLCIAQFAFSYISIAMNRSDSWDSINFRIPEQRIAINRQLAAMPGKLLVFVRYWPQHIFQNEWVYNEADIDRARVVWARDLGDAEDEKLRRYYPDRTVLLLEPDARPPRLTPYQPTTTPKPPEKPQEKSVPKIVFEPVP